MFGWCTETHQRGCALQGELPAGRHRKTGWLVDTPMFAVLCWCWCCLCLATGYMHWKQLLVLLLGCVTGPLESHTSLFVAFLAAATAQLQLGLGSCGSSSTGREQGAAAAGSGEGVGAALFGEGLVEELLPDSFLKHSFRSFFEMLQESGAEAPAQILAQVCVCVFMCWAAGTRRARRRASCLPQHMDHVECYRTGKAVCVHTLQACPACPAQSCCRNVQAPCTHHCTDVLLMGRVGCAFLPKLQLTRMLCCCHPVLCKARVLESVLAAGLGWDFRMTELLANSDDSDSDDEFRPVVVELTEQQLADLEAAAGP